MDGICWGEENPDPSEEPVIWPRWQTDGGLPITVDGDPNWGQAHLEVGDIFVSPVTDTGDALTKRFTITRDKYGVGSGPVTISIRGQVGVFDLHDVLPAWSTYTVPVTQGWRYVQVRMEEGA